MKLEAVRHEHVKVMSFGVSCTEGKKKVGLLRWVIISHNSPRLLLQKERVPRRAEPNRMA